MFCAKNISPAFSNPMVVLSVNGHIQKNLSLPKNFGKWNASALRGKKSGGCRGKPGRK